LCKIYNPTGHCVTRWNTDTNAGPIREIEPKTLHAHKHSITGHNVQVLMNHDG